MGREEGNENSTEGRDGRESIILKQYTQGNLHTLDELNFGNRKHDKGLVYSG